MKLPVVSVRRKGRHFCVNVDKAKDRGDSLGKYGGAGSPCNSHLKVDNEYQVQNHVQHCGKDQEDQRSPAVSHCTQVGGKQVVKNSGNDSRTDDHDVCVGILENIVRRVHQFQQTVHADHAESTDGYGKNQGQKDSVGNADLHSLFVLGAEPSGR